MPYRVYVCDFGRRFLYLQWLDPTTGKKVTRSSKCAKRRDAERAAKELEDRLNEHHSPADGSLPFGTFITSYMLQHCAGMSLKGQKKAIGVLEMYREAMRPGTLADVTAAAIAQYAAQLRSKSRSEATISGHLKTLRAALAWAYQVGLIPFIPKFPRIQKNQVSTLSRGRPITGAEFCRVLRAVREVVPRPYRRSWRHLLRGLWHSGIRLGEALALRWEPGPWPFVTLSGSAGLLVIPAAVDKGRRDRRVPLTPDMIQFLSRTRNRVGFVFCPQGDRGDRVNYYRVSQIVSDIGEKSGVIVEPTTGRTFTAHDLRRSFAQRWAPHLTAVDLQRLMRHASIQTTLGYYLDADTEALATRVANSFANFEAGKPQKKA